MSVLLNFKTKPKLLITETNYFNYFFRFLQPDITAPGLNILAAWSGADSPSKLSIDQRVADYNIYSGTSMSCPHVAGAIALLKAIHPKWSSAALRSALMTTGKLKHLRFFGWLGLDKPEFVN